jgi:indole-3-glycerol phosphate synthase
LIVAALTRAELTGLLAAAEALALDALVEVHDSSELEIAAAAGAGIIGVNNRNLRPLAVDVAASETLIRAMPPGTIAVSESGLKAPADLERLAGLGYHAFLIGERFMTEPDPGACLGAFVRAAA